MFVINANPNNPSVPSLTTDSPVKDGYYSFYLASSPIGGTLISTTKTCCSFTYTAIASPVLMYTGATGVSSGYGATQDITTATGSKCFRVGGNYQFSGGELIGRTIIGGNHGGYVRTYGANSCCAISNVCMTIGLYLYGGGSSRLIAQSCYPLYNMTTCRVCILRLPTGGNGITACAGDMLGICYCFCWNSGTRPYCSAWGFGVPNMADQTTTSSLPAVQNVWTSGVTTSMPIQVSVE